MLPLGFHGARVGSAESLAPRRNFTLRIASRVVSCLLCWPALAAAQSQPGSGSSPPGAEQGPPLSTNGPAISGSAPTVKASVGYAYLNMSLPSSNRIDLSGLDTAVTADFLHRWGATADFTYVRASDVLSTGHHADVLSYLAGPVFYPTQHAKLTTYVRGLIGASRVTGVVPSNGNYYETGYVNKLAWALGGGVEYQVSRSVAFRGGGDYLHTEFFDLGGVIRGQNNFRAVCSVVYVLWQHPERRR
jgi:opacity protein-like surface antigen